MIRLGDSVAKILRSRPATGYLFPQIVLWKESDRAKAFIRRCRLAGVSGVSLHCYRYAWAERAKVAGYPERFAQEALGHSSKAVHRAYVVCQLWVRLFDIKTKSLTCVFFNY
jgi:integrase